MRTKTCNGTDHGGGHVNAIDESLRLSKARVGSLGDWAVRQLHRPVAALNAWIQERRDARELARLPDSVLEDLGFRRVDIRGQPVRERYSTGGDWPNPIRELTPLESYPPVIERIDTNSGARPEQRPAARKPQQAKESIIERVRAMTKHAGKQIPRIARIWRGQTRRERADEYEVYLNEAGIKPLIEKALGVQSLREDRGGETEFVTISYWESIEAMTRFTGGDPTRIHHLERDPEFLIELPKQVQVLSIKASHGNTGGDASNDKV